MKGSLRLSNGRKLYSPHGAGTRPTTSRVREATMNLVRDKIKDANWLDLFSGSGVMGCEALEKGAKTILAVESNKKTAGICNANLELIGISLSDNVNIKVICQEVISLLKKGFKKVSKSTDIISCFDVIYIDPPYDSGLYSAILRELINGKWMKNDALVICEYSSKVQLQINSSWIELDRRIYGGSGLLLLSPPKNYCDDIDSMQPQASLK